MVTLALCGDVMLGRGIDQILADPGDPRLHEPAVTDARRYVALAEQVNGRIARPVMAPWPWGDALPVLDDVAPEVRVLNLETAVTRSDDFAVGKAVHYRMSPGNLPALLAAAPDACALANNHVLDFGTRGLAETLDVLSSAGVAATGAGRDAARAWRPVTVPLPEGGRVLVFAWGMASSGIPDAWSATGDRPGVAVLGESATPLDAIDHIVRHRRAGDIVVVSLHWGSNWGYDVPERRVRLAHALVDAGVDVVHGHSSHHPRPIEIHRDRLILYGCGDFINDYEGIPGHEDYRGDLRLLYLASLDRSTGALAGLRMVPLQSRRLRLQHVSRADRDWLRARLDQVSRPFGVRVDEGAAGTLLARPTRPRDGTPRWRRPVSTSW